ncbi:MAG: Mu transposase C-terminal domain-containing protein, partial [Armatimonadota bacterium]
MTKQMEPDPVGQVGNLPSRTAADILAELQVIAQFDEQAVSIGQLLIELQSNANGDFGRLLQDLRPDLARPDAWADRMIESCKAACPLEPGAADTRPRPRRPGPTAASDQRTAASPSGERTSSPDSVQEALPSATAPGASRTSDPRSLDSRAAKIYSRLAPLLDLSRADRSRRLPAVATELGLSQSTAYHLLQKLRQGGAAALNRKPRADRGRPSVSDGVRTAFLSRRVDPITRQEPVGVTIRHIQGEFPDQDISPYSLRRLQNAIPKALLMENRQWRAEFEPTGQWEVPHPNHTQVFDMTDADLFVWDRQGKPYRPKLTALIDEHTQCCLGGIYTRETPSMAVLQAVLLHGWLPKQDPRWPMYGIPIHLHCDNGKIQTSNWLAGICRSISAQLHDRSGTRVLEGVRHAGVRCPWQDGHIERFYGIVHTHFEAHVFGAAYCGRSTQHKREGFKGSLGGPADWEQYPTLGQLNQAFPLWLVTDYHTLHHSRLKTTRLDAWSLHAPGHVKLVDPDFLYSELLQRAPATVNGARVRVNNAFYRHDLLQAYQGVRLQLRWDPMDLTRVMVMKPTGPDRWELVCWAQRQDARNVDNPR